MADLGLNKKQVSAILKGIYTGLYGIAERNLPESLYRATVRVLSGGVKEAGKGPLIRELNENIFVFSAAKTYTQVKDMSSLITDGDRILPWTKFRDKAMERYNIYNVDWLESELQTAIGQAQTAVKWRELAKSAHMIQRRAVMDANTSPECVILNGIIAPVNDPFWRTRSPLTHFNCRCVLVGYDRFDDVTPSTRKEINAAIDKTEHINPLFKGNPAIDKVIFNDSHPYFDIAPEDKGWAKKNFGLW